MAHEERFDDLLASLIGFYRTWIVALGLELGCFAALRRAGDEGLDAEALAAAVGASAPHIRSWLTAADAHDLVEFDGRRARLPEATAVVLLDEARPEYLGGQFVHATLASLDWDRLADVFRTGVPVRERPDRYRASIERLTLQDVAVFFEEALAALPELVVDLQRGLRVADLHCGGARWLVAVARRFPATTLVGVEAQPDSAARARRNVAEAGLAGRITIEEAEVASIARRAGTFGLVYFQYALHELADPVGALRAGWEALGPGGWLVVLDWCEPSTPDEYRSLHGQLVAGIQLDQLLMGTRLRTVEEFLGFFAAAGLPAPQIIDLPSGATLVVTTKPASDLGGDQRRAIEGSG
jgi:SAM-dependent methyltransferase